MFHSLQHLAMLKIFEHSYTYDYLATQCQLGKLCTNLKVLDLSNTDQISAAET